MNRRDFIAKSLLAGFLISSLPKNLAGSRKNKSKGSIPVILDTDIGDDIDDIWALLFLLNCPELDLKLLVTDSNDTVGKAKIAAKYLDLIGYSHIPIGIGTPHPGTAGSQYEWAAEYDLNQYPGKIYENGVDQMIDTVMSSEEEITIITIGPVPNIHEALLKEPEIIYKARIVAMSGSIYKGYGGVNKPAAEYNVKAYPEAARAMIEADWDVIITPLDTAGLIQLKGDLYQRIYQSDSIALKLIIESYKIWDKTFLGGGLFEPETSSSTLYDTVAVYLAFSPESFVLEEIKILITDDGYMKIDNKGSKVTAAIKWNDKSKFKNLLVERLISELEH